MLLDFKEGGADDQKNNQKVSTPGGLDPSFCRYATVTPSSSQRVQKASSVHRISLKQPQPTVHRIKSWSHENKKLGALSIVPMRHY
jgi:hypothetical protein